ncbi:MAG: hypothetical protein IPK26_24145 [Planctomycetes bacterium]|nr:hypothetical protein [Planctomycetota bacterium]
MDEIRQRLCALDPPIREFVPAVLGDDFAAELRTVSELWFRCGYRPGVASYLAFFLLRDFVVLHDERRPARFASLRAMAASFYRTDLFIRAVTDSGREPSGGLSSPAVRAELRRIADLHTAAGIPDWMMTWFGWTLFEAVETVCAPLPQEQAERHLRYMTRTWRLLGVPFAADRPRMIAFARAVERGHLGSAPQLERHARAILRIGEMIGVSSRPDTIAALLPGALRTAFLAIAARVRPGLLRRLFARLLGALLVPKAVGRPRVAVPLPAS